MQWIPSLLITDDDRAFRETLRNVFEPLGYHTLLAADGEEAVQIVRTATIHVALLDMHMPRLTGLEAIRHIRALHATLPCILISAAMDDALRADARQQGISVLAKPISFAEITSTVGGALAQAYGRVGL